MADVLTVDDAVKAIQRCAFTIHDDDLPTGRRIVHCFIGSMGADWDVTDAIREVRAASLVGWTDSIFGRCLAVLTPDGRTRRFDTVTPE